MDYADGTLIYGAAYGTWRGREVFGACGYAPSCVKLFNNDGTILGSLASEHPLYAMAFAPDSPFIAVGGENGMVHILTQK
eukprot:gnl/Chilomastix_caulleri/4501.p3 GENE.gnl/Chilomastix_caulleri/4501~~gnl/Chilomastix_caulleri/4501.p3  ORF type:complete len:80 (+),score=24.32 gnl/Chilomastix_caulleri/4501:57-296(+)